VADAAADFCLICSMEESDPASRVFLDELWAAEVAPGFEVPGWFFLRARRHAERLTGLDEAETAAFGRRAHDLVSAVERVTGGGKAIDCDVVTDGPNCEQPRCMFGGPELRRPHLILR